MKVATWNLEARLSQFAESGMRGSPHAIVDAIERLNSDVLVLPEAFDQAMPIEPAIWGRIKSFGYQVINIAYQEDAVRHDAAVVDPHMTFLSRLDIVHSRIIRPGGLRNMVEATVCDPETNREVRIFGIHLDDRNEKNRLAQVYDLSSSINELATPTIVMGDFNAMHYDTLASRILSGPGYGWLIGNLPDGRVKGVAGRLSEMALGDTLNVLYDTTNLRTTNNERRATMTPKMRGQERVPAIPLVEIDHIFISPDIISRDFQVSGDGGSDHRAISASVSMARQNKPPVL